MYKAFPLYFYTIFRGNTGATTYPKSLLIVYMESSLGILEMQFDSDLIRSDNSHPATQKVISYKTSLTYQHQGKDMAMDS